MSPKEGSCSTADDDSDSPKATFRAGTAKINLNPSESVWLAGFGARKASSAGIISNLYVRALALEDGTGQRLLLISIDHLGFGRPMMEKIAENLMRDFALTRERLVIAFTHTHSAPVCDRSIHTIYPGMSADGWAAVERYGILMRKRIKEAAFQAFAALEPVQLFFGKSVAGFGVNRRRAQSNFQHFPGPVDHDVPILKVVAISGEIKSLVFGYACHATTLKFNQISADFPGFATEELEKLHPKAVCFFMAGCGADINPLPRESVKLANYYGHILASVVNKAASRSDLVELRAPVHAERQELTLAFKKPPALDKLNTMSHSKDTFLRSWAQYWVDKLRSGEHASSHCPYPVQTWHFGPDFVWVFLTAEVCVDYSLRIKAELNHKSIWVSAYANELVGYIPSERLLEEGGYEGGDSKVVFNLPAEFAAGVENTIIDCITEMASRNLPHSA